jgi:hypothetical protein
MWDRVMNVKQIEFVQFRNLSHTSRERKIVRRILKEWVVRNHNFVKVNVRMRLRQADRLRVGDEMHLVTALGEFDAKFRGHYSAATVGWITGDADSHSWSRFPLRRLDSAELVSIQACDEPLGTSSRKEINSIPVVFSRSKALSSVSASRSISRDSRNLVVIRAKSPSL